MTGMGAYASPGLDFLVEGVIVLTGWLLYSRAMAPHARGSYATWAMLAMLRVAQGVFDALFATGAVG